MTATIILQRQARSEAGRALLVALLILCAASAMTTALVTTTVRADDGGGPLNELQIKALLNETWKDALHKWEVARDDLTGPAGDMAKLYHQDAQLLPTVGGGVWKQTSGQHGGETIADYFSKKFMSKHPWLVDVAHEFVKPLGKNHASSQGLYTFVLEKPGNGPAVVFARFSFLYQYDDAEPDRNKRWKILKHHSSAEPRRRNEDADKQQNVIQFIKAFAKVFNEVPIDHAGDANVSDLVALYHGTTTALWPYQGGGSHTTHNAIKDHYEGFFLGFPAIEIPVVPELYDMISIEGQTANVQGVYKYVWLVGENEEISTDVQFTFTVTAGEGHSWADNDWNTKAANKAKISFHHEQERGNDCPADLNSDGTVGVPDLLKLLWQWGPCP